MSSVTAGEPAALSFKCSSATRLPRRSSRATGSAPAALAQKTSNSSDSVSGAVCWSSRSSGEARTGARSVRWRDCDRRTVGLPSSPAWPSFGESDPAVSFQNEAVGPACVEGKIRSDEARFHAAAWSRTSPALRRRSHSFPRLPTKSWGRVSTPFVAPWAARDRREFRDVLMEQFEFFEARSRRFCRVSNRRVCIPSTSRTV